jgi:hypothetical protein
MHFGFPLDLHPSESEIVDAVFQPEKPIRGEPVESCKLRYFNSFEFFDLTGDDVRNFFVGITPTQNSRHGVKFFIQT